MVLRPLGVMLLGRFAYRPFCLQGVLLLGAKKALRVLLIGFPNVLVPGSSSWRSCS
jgi:hypothetical protein